MSRCRMLLCRRAVVSRVCIASTSSHLKAMADFVLSCTDPSATPCLGLPKSIIYKILSYADHMHPLAELVRDHKLLKVTETLRGGVSLDTLAVIEPLQKELGALFAFNYSVFLPSELIPKSHHDLTWAFTAVGAQRPDVWHPDLLTRWDDRGRPTCLGRFRELDHEIENKMWLMFNEPDVSSQPEHWQFGTYFKHGSFNFGRAITSFFLRGASIS